MSKNNIDAVTQNIHFAIENLHKAKQELCNIIDDFKSSLNDAVEGILVLNPQISNRDKIQNDLDELLEIADTLRDFTITTEGGKYPIIHEVLHDAAYFYYLNNRK